MIQYPVSYPPEDKCSHCGKSIEVERPDFGPGEDIRMPQGAGRLEISFGYGSRNDLRNLVMYICDDCIIPFVESRKAKVGEFCCLWFDEDKKLSPNCVLDQLYSGRHHQALLDSGVKFATTEELFELLADPPSGGKLPPCKSESPDGAG